MRAGLRVMLCGTLAVTLVGLGPAQPARAAPADRDAGESSEPSKSRGGAVTRIVVPEKGKGGHPSGVDTPAATPQPEAPRDAKPASDDISLAKDEPESRDEPAETAEAETDDDAANQPVTEQPRESELPPANAGIELGNAQEGSYAPQGTRVAGPASSGPKVDPANYKTVLTGNIVTGFGGATFIAMIVGIVMYSGAKDAVDRERRQDPRDVAQIDEALRKRDVGLGLTLGGAAASLLLFTTGIALIATGRKRERERRAKLAAGLPAPSLGAQQLGVEWALRF